MEPTAQLNTLYTLFVKRYLHNLSLYTTPVNATCAIHIGEIRGVFERCKLQVLNFCSSNKELSFKLLVKTFREISEILPDKERDALAKEIGIDLTKADDDPNQDVVRNCNASSDINNVIDIQKFDAGYCVAPENKHILLQIVNSGSAEANCVISSIVRATNKRALPDEFVNNRLRVSNRPWFIVFAVFVLIVFVICVCSIKRKINLKYRYGSFLYV
ncbi:M019L [Myxoma virus]|uniref:M019L n=1 Tax=Myxoma virus TaxID=10273 RepID=A0A481NP37_9POXV|nr:M019L [Myxoma virus]QAV42444.1 M019L [Myxoma virus]